MLLLTLTGCNKNSFSAEIQVGYRTVSETSYTENNIFYVNEDIYIKVQIDNFFCTTCGEFKEKKGTFIITFNNLEEKEEPTQIGGRQLIPIPNSDTSIKQYEFTVVFKKSKDNAWAVFHMRPTVEGLTNFTISLVENGSITSVGVVDVRGYND